MSDPVPLSQALPNLPPVSDSKRPVRASWIVKAIIEFVISTSIAGVILAGVLLFVSVTTNVFWSPGNLKNVMTQATVLAPTAIGMTFLFGLRKLDLSIGAIGALSGFVFFSVVSQQGSSPIFAILASLVTGSICGLVNGAIAGCSTARTIGLSIVVTWLSGTAYRTLTLLLTNGHQMLSSMTDQVDAVASVLFSIGPCLIVILVLLGQLGSLLASRVPTSTDVKREAAGFWLNWLLTLLMFCVSGLLAAVSGVAMACRLRSLSPLQGTGIELEILSAILIGGSSLLRGRSNPVGTLLGVMAVVILADAFNLLNITVYAQNIAFLVLVALCFLIDGCRYTISKRLS
jgi:ribose/xylose/arabinose/galactoside ABC-type transport system permease subunit